VFDEEADPAWDEKNRLAALRSYRVLDTPREPEFDELAQLPERACAAPVALISLVEDRRQWFKAEVGLGLRETPLEQSVCAKSLRERGLVVIPDLTQDARFETNPLVTGEPRLRFYAGARLETPDGLPLGRLCVLDYAPRDVAPDQAFTLSALAPQVMAQLQLRRAVAERDEALTASQRAEQRQVLLVRELHHRVRNSLAMVQSLLGATARTARSGSEFYRSFSARIGSLAKTQTLLTDDYWQTAPLRELVLKELRPFAVDGEPRFTISGPELELAADLAVPLGMALHELATNATRHGALAGAAGRVEVTWDLRTHEGVRTVRLDWRERGGPPVQGAQREGFGTTLLRKILPMQVNAAVEVRFEGDGLACRIEAPLVERRLVPEY